ncbi:MULTISPECIES: type I-B CRISPR-associated protein Cas5b [unclassified Clostridioides]|uniref:type I-B CRISPR-associated protein Cas5b n=1 Tax=unclassified Clostridioides TaxID=2635829 RepID=UPI001D0C6F25|nr:type I-B CRISPR-associated protein Cas5 [Clostridioides sp. ES-S-0001-02]MCC0651319.1 type I-B CRISPR-associated protein Cas5 [Clostridioides sp. ES-S-0001-03]MCC0673840.1 type I-B CRISPR-associated protein Cas5 [Clostridioides sp. ES-S-0145-01]MCC0694720.1 type I-B CRISPR-associated protein Cas5 [Clostridioides sp. ES-S-0048-02]MCC0706346.1 type I-B CRISPR-associated protein Cas5 [Clostridioides sp. ES-S-0190-01]MCC0762888.1 type I-B CRISPR-associated protein Cas5 [Clostridioides sp. ES-S-
MKVLKLDLFQETACYKKPFAMKITETYPLPPYSTVNGLIHKILNATEYIPFNISVQGTYESIFNNYQTTYFYKKDSVTSMPMNSHMLLNVNLIIHIGGDFELLKNLYDSLLNCGEHLSLGRKEDLVRINDIRFVEVNKFEVDEDIQLDDYENYRLSKYNIRMPIYIPKSSLQDEYIEGISYRLNNYYDNNAKEDKKRVWNKVDSYYVDDGIPISVGDILLDNEGDLLYFNNINWEEEYVIC